MSHPVVLPDDVYDRLKRSAAQRQVDIPTLLEEWLRQHEQSEVLQLGMERAGPLKVSDSETPPFRRDSRLGGIQFVEDPTAPLAPEDWPEAFTA